MKNLFAKFALIFAICIAITLSACASAPITQNKIEPQQDLQPKQQSEQTQSPVTQATQNKNVSKEQVQVAQNETIEPIITNTVALDSVKLDSVKKDTEQVAIDPYLVIPEMITQIFDHANMLFKNGLTDSATAYIERLRIIKPLWIEWESKADSLLQKFGKIRAKESKEFESIVLQIQNMNLAQADYGLVSQMVDSLIALSPGDSLENWAKLQKFTAYNNTLKKAKIEFEKIKDLADNQAQFSEAISKANILLMRYRDFEDTLHIQDLISRIQVLSANADSSATAYWEKNSPEQALAKADSLIQQNKFDMAHELLKKLKFSKLRKEATEKSIQLADTYCTHQRKATSQLFSRAQKQKDISKKSELLQNAIIALDKCLENYPETTQSQKVIENKSFLQSELQKLQ